MANGKISIDKDYKFVDISKQNVSLVKNQQKYIDLSSDVTSNTPSGYKFDHLEYLGSWPASTWTDALVTRVYAYDLAKTTLYLVTRATQNYTIKVRIWYRS